MTTQQIQLWEVPFDEVFILEDRLYSQLSADERARANRFHFLRDRRAYIISHGVLRCLLGHYMKCTTDAISFQFNEYGKPSIDGGIAFNMSYTQDVGLMTFTCGPSIGVDIEKIDSSVLTDELLDQVLTPKELNAYHTSLNPSEFFFEIWTRKEAYIKALGTGLSTPLKSFAVLNQSINDYYFHSINISTMNHVANVAVYGSETQISTYSVNNQWC